MKRWIVGVKLKNQDDWFWFSTSNGLHPSLQKAHMFNSIDLAQAKHDQYRWHVEVNSSYYLDVKIVQFECTEEEMK